MVTADMEPGFYDHILRGRHFDGVIMFSSDIDDPILPLLIKDGSPLVLIGRHPFFVNLASVDVENREGAREAVAHLIQLGHRRIGIVNGQLEMEPGQARRDGYKQALLEAGFGIDPKLMVEGRFSESVAYQAALQLLDLTDPPTAIFVASDGMATGVLRAIHYRGLRVPEDVAIVGFDDLPLAQHTTPPLTTVRQPVSEMSAAAVRLLIEQIRGEGPVTPVRLPAHLVVRQSSGGRTDGSPYTKGGRVLANSVALRD
jgi:LacI family transcriptional regulator